MSNEQLKVLVEQMPAADANGRYCTGIDKTRIETAIAEIAKGGKDYVQGLVDMLVAPGAGDDVKPHYALHSLGNYLLQIKDKTALGEFAAVLAGQLGGSRPKGVQAYLCQELQWFGHGAAAPALGKLLNDEELSGPAAMALVAIRDGAAEQFRRALPEAKGRSKLNIVQGFGAVADPQAIASLRALLADEDREVRVTAGWGLARMGDAGSAALLIKAAGVEDGWERIQATKHCLVLAEKLTAAGKKGEAAKVYAYLAQSRKEPHEQYVRDLAQKALAK